MPTVADVEPQLHMESFAYWGIDGTNSVIHNTAKVADTRSYTENTAVTSWTSITVSTPVNNTPR